METFQGRSQKKIKTEVMFMDKIMTEAMSTVKFSSQVFRVLNEKNDRENEKMTEASASVCLIPATALLC